MGGYEIGVATKSGTCVCAVNNTSDINKGRFHFSVDSPLKRATAARLNCLAAEFVELFNPAECKLQRGLEASVSDCLSDPHMHAQTHTQDTQLSAAVHGFTLRRDKYWGQNKQFILD